MDQLSRWMALLARFRPRRSARLLAALLAATAAGLGVSGCTPRWQIPTTLYIAVGVNNDQTIDSELVRDVEDKLKQLEQGFQRLYPNTAFQISLYPEAEIVEAIRLRSNRGLGPDLALVSGSTASQLLEQGLTDPFPASAEQLNALDPGDLRRIRVSGSNLVGLPLLVQAQLSCFNRQKLPAPPATVDELLAAAANGIPVGLPSTIENLFWTAGSLGALSGIEQASRNQTPSEQGKAGIQRWLSWLQNASYQQRVMFFSSQKQAEDELMSGQLDWIPCRSTALPRLRRKLGDRLGVAPLPDGDTDTASPIVRLRVLALGKNSSGPGRQRALAFSRYGLNPLTQRNITVGSAVYLPANRFVRVPVASSSVLAAMQTAGQQGRQANTVLNQIHISDRRIGRMQNLVNELVFGEVNPGPATDQMIRILREGR
jgi:ABC-type glycerol-3-phosphate transport system substrate-binding protein